jgi:hypothetical protein
VSNNIHCSKLNYIIIYVGFDDLTAVVMNVAIFLGLTSCNPSVILRFGGWYHVHLHGRKSEEEETSVQKVATDKYPRFV